MEAEFKIPIPGTKLNIYAKQYGSLDRPVIIFVHGLTGHMDEHPFYNGAQYFYDQGISSLRFNLYDWQKDARKLTNCTLKIHANDLNLVIDYLREKSVKKIFAIGHSYGGPTILLADQSKLDAIVLWDPSYGDIFDNTKYIQELDAYRIRWGTDILISAKMYEERKQLDWDNLTTNIQTPLKIISAGKGELLKGSKVYIKKAKGPTEHAIIENAGHNFNEEGTAEKLFEETLQWLKQNS